MEESNTSITSQTSLQSGIIALSFHKETFTVMLQDGRALIVPYFWYPFLATASLQARRDFAIETPDTVWWNALEEGITLEAIMYGKPDTSRHAVWWRKEHGYAWLDAALEERMTTKERQMRDKQLVFLRTTFGTPPTRYERSETASLLTAAEVLAALAKEEIVISKQRLHQLTQGFTQVKRGTAYSIQPLLKEGDDWLRIAGKIRYAKQSIERLKRQNAQQA